MNQTSSFCDRVQSSWRSLWETPAKSNSQATSSCHRYSLGHLFCLLQQLRQFLPRVSKRALSPQQHMGLGPSASAVRSAHSRAAKGNGKIRLLDAACSPRKRQEWNIRTPRERDKEEKLWQISGRIPCLPSAPSPSSSARYFALNSNREQR